ncbi:MAG: RrF2 family transcriptional regulator [Microcoleaceae cyanobacterium]
MELSCKTQYALLALLELANRHDQGEPIQVRQLAAIHQIPDRYLEQLLATLKRGGLVRSQRGAKGGYLLAKEPLQITLFDIVNCLEGAATENSSTHSSHPGQIVVQEVWQEAQQAANSVLQKHTLQDLCEQLEVQQQVNLMYYI